MGRLYARADRSRPEAAVTDNPEGSGGYPTRPRAMTEETALFLLSDAGRGWLAQVAAWPGEETAWVRTAVLADAA